MELQDILYLLIFLVISLFSKKTKNNSSDEETDNHADMVRKKIEALKRKRNRSALEEDLTSIESETTSLFPEKQQKNFSAYKHLPVCKQLITETQEIKQETPVVKIKKSLPQSSQNTLRKGMKWHIILSKPVCTRSFYGNFTNR